MGKLTCVNAVTHSTVSTENKIHVMTTKDDVEKIFNYELYQYYDTSVKILNRHNDIMYENVWDNYMFVLKDIAKRFDEKFDFEKIDIALLLVNERHMQTYIYMQKANVPLLFIAKKFEHSTTNRLLTDLIDTIRSEGIGINGAIGFKTTKNLCLTTHDDWEFVEK